MIYWGRYKDILVYFYIVLFLGRPFLSCPGKVIPIPPALPTEYAHLCRLRLGMKQMPSTPDSPLWPGLSLYLPCFTSLHSQFMQSVLSMASCGLPGPSGPVELLDPNPKNGLQCDGNAPLKNLRWGSLVPILTGCLMGSWCLLEDILAIPPLLALATSPDSLTFPFRRNTCICVG